MHVRRIAFVVALAVSASACASAPPAPPTRPTPSPAPSARAPSTEPALALRSPSDLAADHEAAYARATALAARRDLDGAIRELLPIARATATRTDVALAYWIHNELTWLRWGRGDVRGALAETDLGGRALARSSLAAGDVASMRLHETWDRAYLLLELGDAEADRAFAAYETLARARGDHDGLAVLTAFFAARRHHGAEAAAAARRVDVEKDTDLQDLYVIALALDADGDRAAARAVRERICRGDDYLMKPLIVTQMEREGFACP